MLVGESKSSLGRALAERLELPFLELDQRIASIGLRGAGKLDTAGQGLKEFGDAVEGAEERTSGGIGVESLPPRDVTNATITPSLQ